MEIRWAIRVFDSDFGHSWKYRSTWMFYTRLQAPTAYAHDGYIGRDTLDSGKVYLYVSKENAEKRIKKLWSMYGRFNVHPMKVVPIMCKKQVNGKFKDLEVYLEV